MKLITYRPHGADATESPLFGVVRGGQAVRFTAAAGYDTQGLASIETYLEGLPGTFERASAIAADPTITGVELDDVKLLPALPRPAAILDCGLSPTHLRASSRTLLRHSLPAPVGGPLGRILGRAASKSTTIRFYKGNHHSVSGPGDEITWPDFTAYLDIEPELAVVTGPEPQRLTDRVLPAGYIIYNDASARDVQLAEMLFTGPASSKDFDTGNGIGPTSSLPTSWKTRLPSTFTWTSLLARPGTGPPATTPVTPKSYSRTFCNGDRYLLERSSGWAPFLAAADWTATNGSTPAKPSPSTSMA